MFGGEIGFDFGFSIGVKFGNAARDGIAIDVLLGGFDEGVNIANFGDDFGGISVFLGFVTAIGRGGALEVAEGFGEGVVTTAKDPVDNLAFSHGVEVV